MSEVLTFQFLLAQNHSAPTIPYFPPDFEENDDDDDDYDDEEQ